MKTIFFVLIFFSYKIVFAQEVISTAKDTILNSQYDTITNSGVVFASDSSIRVHTPKDSSHNYFSNYWNGQVHSPSKAALFSAIIPGLGEVYNHKYWKVPIVYAALGTSTYFIISNYKVYNDLKDNYLIRTDGDSTTIDNYLFLPDSYLLQYVDQWRKYSDLAVIITTAIYLLNIIDAVVDAHLYNFDVSDDLSMSIQPYFSPSVLNAHQHLQTTFGMSLKFNLR